MPADNGELYGTILPLDIRRFLEAGIVLDDAMFPVRYADPDHFDAFQLGFRRHGLTGQSLVSVADDAWQPDWYVLALNGLDDPFFVNFRENGYPVRFARHGTGVWSAQTIAPSLASFTERLSALQATAHDDALFAAVLRELSSVGPFWNEAYAAHLEAVAEQVAAPLTAYNDADYVEGALVVTASGPHKLKVAQIASRQLEISLKDALALASRPEFTIATGAPIQLRRIEKQLTALGSSSVFRAS